MAAAQSPVLASNTACAAVVLYDPGTSARQESGTSTRREGRIPDDPGRAVDRVDMIPGERTYKHKHDSRTRSAAGKPPHHVKPLLGRPVPARSTGSLV